MGNVVFINKNRLSMTSEDAVDFIYEYFNGFDVVCIERCEGYYIDLEPNRYTYCEDMSNGLHMLGIPEDGVGSFCVVRNNIALCLSENWLPYAYVKMKEGERPVNKELTIIHIDDHSDLMSPFLHCKDGKIYDMICGNVVDFEKSESVRQAVISGAITIGSMLTAITYSEENAKIIHLKVNSETKSYVMNKSSIRDETFLENCDRIVIKMKMGENGKGTYTVTSKWEEVLNNVSNNAECLLHIDMDYFNNRYNASTSWFEQKERHDPSIEEQKVLMNEMFDGVVKIMKKAEIKYILIGISPSFYPVEYWKDGLQYLVEGFERIGLKVGTVFETIYEEAVYETKN